MFRLGESFDFKYWDILGVFGLFFGGCGSLGVFGFIIWLKVWVGVFGLYFGYCFERLGRIIFWLLIIGDNDFWDSVGLLGLELFLFKVVILGWLGVIFLWFLFILGLISFC